MSAIALDKRKNGVYRARWDDERLGRRVSWQTGTTNKNEAKRLALEEQARRRGSSAAVPPATSHPPGPLPGGAPPAAAAGTRRPLGEAFARVLAPPPPAPGVASPAPAGGAGFSTSLQAAAAIVPDAVVAPVKQAARDLEDEAQAKVRHVHKVAGKAATRILEGVLKRACKFAGREPEDMDDDEEALIQEGMEELAAEYLGKKKLTPGGKVMAGALCAGVGMYMGGKPIPKPAKPVLKMVPERPAVPAPPEKPDDGSHGA